MFTYAWDGQTPGVLTTVDVPQSAAGPIQVGGAVWTVAGGYVSGSHFSQHQVVLGTGQSTIDVVCTPPAFPDFPDGGRLNGIQLVFTPPSPPGPTGLTFCSSLPNSAGQTAAIGATATVLPSGSIDAFANDLTVFATDMPANQPGIFFFGTSAIDFPFGNGIRCVGGSGAAHLASVDEHRRRRARALDRLFDPRGRVRSELRLAQRSVLVPRPAWRRHWLQPLRRAPVELLTSRVLVDHIRGRLSKPTPGRPRPYTAVVESLTSTALSEDPRGLQ